MCTSSRSIILSSWAWEFPPWAKPPPILAKVSAVGFFVGDGGGDLLDHLLCFFKKAAIFMDDFFGMAFGSQSSFHDSIIAPSCLSKAAFRWVDFGSFKKLRIWVSKILPGEARLFWSLELPLKFLISTS